MIVYRLTNIITNKVYIGITTQTMSQRMIRHKARFNRGDKYKLYNAWHKYGWDSFVVDIIDETPQTVEELLQAEKKYIALYDSYHNGYNSTLGGEDNPMDREDVQEKHLNSMRSAENRERVSQFFKEFQEKYPESEKARRAKISEALKGERNGMYGKLPPNAKRIGMYTLDTDELVKEFETAKEAIEYIQTIRPNTSDNGKVNINSCARGERKKAYGYKWRYLE